MPWPVEGMDWRAAAQIGPIKIAKGGGEADVNVLLPDGVPVMALDVTGPKYFWYHHSQADTMDKLDPHEISACAAAFAVMAYQVADAPLDLPR